MAIFYAAKEMSFNKEYDFRAIGTVAFLFEEPSADDDQPYGSVTSVDSTNDPGPNRRLKRTAPVVS